MKSIAPQAITLQQIREIQDPEINEGLGKALNLRKDRLLQLMGMLNAYGYCVGVRWGIFSKNIIDDGEQTKVEVYVDSARMRNAIAGCAKGEGTVSVSTLWLSDYLKRNWPGAANSPNSIRAMREFIANELKLFTFTKVAPGSTVHPVDLENVDLAGMLLIYECLEKEYISRFPIPEPEIREQTEEERSLTGDVTFVGWNPAPMPIDFLPKHRGIAMVRMFDALFGKIRKYGREEPECAAPGDAIALPEVVEKPVSPAFVPTWKPEFAKRKLTKQIFHRLARLWEKLVPPSCDDDWVCACV